MPSGEQKIACTCGACELALADGKAAYALRLRRLPPGASMGIQKRRHQTRPLPRIYYMRSDIIDVKGRDKTVVVKLREDGAVRRLYCTNCYSILGHVHAIFNNNVFGNFVEHCINTGDLTAPLS